MCLHVDDILWAGDDTLNEGVVQSLRDKFPKGKESAMEFEYLGLLFKATRKDSMTITVSQRHYVESVEEIDVKGTKRQDTSLANEVQHSWN